MTTQMHTTALVIIGGVVKNAPTLPTVWKYDPVNPLVVKVRFGDPIDIRGIEWVISRDLLAEGLSEPSGMGDVHARSEGNLFYLTLQNSETIGTYAFSLTQVEGFLHAAYRELSPSEETPVLSVATDLALKKLLAGEGRES